MKTGKTIAIKVHPKFKSYVGTVDSKNLKSIYVQFSSWAQPSKNIIVGGVWLKILKNF